jgi:predicted dehydrogenase
MTTRGIRRGRSPIESVGIVGAGRVVSDYYLPAVLSLADQVILFDRDRNRAEALARRSGRFTAIDDLEALVNLTQVQVVATPARTHGAVVNEILERSGAPRLLIEKPPATSSDELESLLDRGEQRVLGIRGAFFRRALPAPRAARAGFREWLRTLGPLDQVHIWEGRPYAWKSEAAKAGGLANIDPILLDELTHPLDLLFFIGGDYVRGAQVTGVSVSELAPTAVDVGFHLLAPGGRDVGVQLVASREKTLANLIKFSFSRGAVMIETFVGGGLVVVDTSSGSRRALGLGVTPSVSDVFAAMVAEAAGRPEAQPCEYEPAPLSEWADPAAILSALAVTA